jgi:hypothetical protein
MPSPCTCHDGLTCVPCYRALLATSARTGFALPAGLQTHRVVSTMTEAQLLTIIREICKRLDVWKIYHTHCSKKSEPGFPDVVLVRPQSLTQTGRLIFAELKREGASPTLPQQHWLDALRTSVKGVESYLWTPSDLDTIVEVLRR